MPAMIAFKTISALDQWHQINPLLRQIVFECLAIWPDPYMEVTRIADKLTVGSESGVHITGAPHRALDLRTNDLPPAEGTKVEHIINTRWFYGSPVNPSQKCAMQHGEGSNRHLHLQVRAETHARFTEPMATT